MIALLATLIALGEIESAQDLQFAEIVKQGFDYTCGIAAAATLLGYFGVTASEDELLAEVAARGAATAPDEGGRLAITLTNIIDLLSVRGIQSRAYRMTAEQMADALRRGFAPLLVHFGKPEPHFTLVLGIDGDLVLCADPTVGLVGIEVGHFMEMWSGVVLATASSVHARDGARIAESVRTIAGRRNLLEKTSCKIIEWGALN
jgi:uncharacterized protein